jgi:nitroreductase
MLRQLVMNNRSRRRFYQDYVVTPDTLRELVDLARLSASAANLQPLKYVLSCDPQRNSLIHPHIRWAGYLKEWHGPPEGERPSAYVIVLGDTGVSKAFGCDHGIAAQSILLGATEKGLGGCIVANLDRERLRSALEIPPRYEILLVLALGKPRESVVTETLEASGDVRYWRDGAGIHHVPKRRLDDIVID